MGGITNAGKCDARGLEPCVSAFNHYSTRKHRSFDRHPNGSLLPSAIKSQSSCKFFFSGRIILITPLRFWALRLFFRFIQFYFLVSLQLCCFTSSGITQFLINLSRFSFYFFLLLSLIVLHQETIFYTILLSLILFL